MLLSFIVENFRSFKDRVQLDMFKTSLRGLSTNYIKNDKKNILNATVLYGANASGKSGFLRAVHALEYLVLHSSEFKPDAKILPYEPFALDKGKRNLPVHFEINFISEGVHYEYKVSYSKFHIEFEELSIFRGNYKSFLYTREEGKNIKFGDSYKGAKKIIEQLVLPNQLFLTKAAENNVEVVMGAYRFFDSILHVFPMLEGTTEEDVKRLYARRLAEDKDSSFSKKFNALICALDTGITHVSAQESDWKSLKFPSNTPQEVVKKIQDQYKYNIKAFHPLYENGKVVGQQPFEIDEESAGTKNLFALGGIILEALEEGHVLIVDELEKNLHPSVTSFLIQLFHNPDINRNQAQLLFATHDVTQLSNDIFRRDQVWFAEKDETGASTLFRCSDIEGVRLNTPLDKWYGAGRLGATPIINDVDFLIAMQE